MTNNNNDFEVEYHNLLFGVQRSIRYHGRRQLFFDRINKCSNILTAITGSATFFSIISKHSNLALIFALSVAILSAIDLVVGTAQAARFYNDLRRRFHELEKEIILLQDKKIDSLTPLKALRLDIEADEPPLLKALNRICHNELITAGGYDKSEYKKLKWYQRWFAHFFDIRFDKDIAV